MPAQHLIAKAQTTIDASIEKVWDALVTPALIKQYMFGSDVESDWEEGSAITWKGEWQGKTYEDKGIVIQNIPYTRLQYTHFSPMTGKPDRPENYHLVTIDLTDHDKQTEVTLTQGNNTTEEERHHSEKNWKMMLGSLKEVVEKQVRG